MKKFLLFMIGLVPLLGIGQTTLSPGDVVILSFQGYLNSTESLNDNFSFMPLVDLQAGTTIHFTDIGWVGGAFASFEDGTSTLWDMITYTAPTAITAGTVIRSGKLFTTNFTVHSGSPSANNYIRSFNSTTTYATSADQIIVFQGTKESPSFIWAIANKAWGTASTNNSNSDLPSGLTNGTNAMYLPDMSSGTDVTVEDAAYTGSFSDATASDWRARILNTANWTISADGTPVITPVTGSYTVISTNSAPTDISLSATSINENVSGGSTVGTLSTTDPDAGNTFTYTLVSGDGSTDNNSFTISGASLNINDSPNFESKSSYAVRIRTTDQGGLWYEEAFTITINDLNDNTPVVTAAQSFSIAENIANSASVGTVVATDGDAGTTFSGWTETGGSGASIFAINSSTGEITVADNSSIDYETTTSYTYTVTVSDGTNTSAAGSITINITDVNDNTPVVTAAQSFSIAENIANSASVGTVVATDGDAGTTFSGWTETGGSGASIFAINSSTGEITVADNSSIDYETTTSYTYTVTVSDGTNTSAAGSITINITDILTPTVTTASISTFDGTSATLGGEVTATGGATVTERGVVYSKTSENSDPMISGSNVTKDSNGDGTGTFGESITGLAYNTQYSVKAYASNSEGTSYGSVQTFTTSAAAGSIFSGSGNWSLPSNWTSGVPGATTAVTIIGPSTVDVDFTVASLNILAGNVTIAPNQTLTVSGTLTNSAGVTGLVVNSDNTGTGKLITSSAVPATIKQFLTKDQWHYMGIHFAGEQEVVSIFKGLYVYKSDEAAAEHNERFGWTALVRNDMVKSDRGYGIFHAELDTTIAVKGTLKSGSIDYPVAYSGADKGWNLIANPYPCTIDWNTGIEKTAIEDASYVWNPVLGGTNKYGCYGSFISGISTDGQTQFIAPMQGFFVKASQTGNVTFAQSTKTTSASTFKSAELQTIVRLALSDAQGATDESVIRFHALATEAFDGNLDAYKLKAATSLTPQLYSVYKGTEYSINSLAEVTEQTVVPFELMIKQSGQHTLSLTELTGYNEALPIVLFNEAGQQLANLQTGDYTFTAQAGEVVKVKLAFNTVLTSAEQFSNSFLRVAIDGNNLSVSGLGQGRSDVQLFSISGQLLQSHQPVGDALQVSNLNRGVYLLRVKDSNGLLGVRKVVIQ